MKNRKIKIFPTADELSLCAAEEFALAAAESIDARGQFTVALSGGTTPKKLYALLASGEFKNRIDWRKVHFFWGDERMVAPDDRESNFRAANDFLLSKIGLPPENVHRFLTERSDARAIAEKMETEIRVFFGLKKGEFPRFDLILLGIGADGHTASLFPETAALEERKKIVVANYVSKFETFRLTFTIPTINSARRVMFLAAGADKAEALREVLEGTQNPRKFPAQLIRPNNGKLSFLLDDKAALLLEKSLEN